MTKDETWDGLREFPVKGNYFEILETDSAVDVVAFDNQGNPLNVENAVEQGFWIDRRGQVPFSRLNITTTGATRVKFLVTDGTAGNRAVPSDITSDAARLLGIVYGSLGQLAQVLVNAVNYLRVQVQGKGDAETDAGNAFIGSASIAGAGAVYSHVQLKNPAASGKVVYVDAILTSQASGALQLMHVTRYDTDLTTAIGAAVNRDIGGAASSALLKSQNIGAVTGTELSRTLTASEKEFTFDPPLKLGAGEGVVSVTGVVNVANHAVFKFREYDA